MPNPKVTALFNEALDLSKEARAKLLEAESTDVRREVEELLSFHEQATGFLDEDVSERARKLFAVPSPAPELDTGSAVGDFVIKKALGAGSFGTVYLATQTSLERDVAI